MNNDFKIVILISHNRISFEYYLKGGADALQPIITDANSQGIWPSPFSIYCSPTGIIIGEDAFHAAKRGTRNAYDNIFERMKEADCFYEFCGTRKHVSDLLLDACETIFRDFYSKVLLNNCGNLEQNRSTMPIVFVCEEDISENESAIIANKFTKSGYGCVSFKKYQPYLEKYVKIKYNQRYQNALTVWTEGKDLYLTLFDIKGQQSSESTKLINLGIDPRLDYVIEQIWNAVISRNGFLSKEDEIDVLRDAASSFLNSTDSLVTSYVSLSDGGNYPYTLDRNSINFYQYTTKETLLRGVNDFLRRNVTQQKNTLVILRGVAANNNYFSTVFNSFTNIIVSDNDLRSQVMRAIIEDPTTSVQITSEVNPLPPTILPNVDFQDINREWRNKKADVIGKIHSKKYSEAESILTNMYRKATEANAIEIINKIDELKKQIPENLVNPVTPISMKREWRELKAIVCGLLRSGKNEEARIRLNEFLTECNNTNNLGLISEIEKLIKDTTESQTIRNRPKKSKPLVIKEQKSSGGEELLRKGKIIEARDWLKSKGDNNKLRLLNEIIRIQKSVETRKKELSNCQRTKDFQRIKRIIIEISDYIEKCQRLCIPSEEYKNLLAEYKKIK